MFAFFLEIVWFPNATEEQRMSHQNGGHLGMWVLPIVAHGQLKELLSEPKRVRKTVLRRAKLTSRV